MEPTLEKIIKIKLHTGTNADGKAAREVITEILTIILGKKILKEKDKAELPPPSDSPYAEHSAELTITIRKSTPAELIVAVGAIEQIVKDMQSRHKIMLEDITQTSFGIQGEGHVHTR